MVHLLGADVAAQLASDLPAPIESPPPTDRVEDLQSLGALWPRWLAGAEPAQRSRQGSWYTPPALCALLVGQALAVWGRPDKLFDQHAADPGAASDQSEAAWVLDPACGDGRFLWVALDAQIARGVAARDALGRLCGIDRDPGAVWLCRAGLWQRWQAEGGVDPAQVRAQVIWGSALPGQPDDGSQAVQPLAALAKLGALRGADLVVGNPPYLSQLRGAAVRDRAAASALAEATGGEVVVYTDTAAAFWALGSRWLAPGGVLCLLLPRSVLAARDAASVRRGLASRLTLHWAWRDARAMFDAAVRTAALILADRPRATAIAVCSGLPPAPVAALPAVLASQPERWSAVLLDAADHAVAVPAELQHGDHPTITQLAVVTADFRDEYYGLAPALAEAPADAHWPVVTSGLVDPLGHAWGLRPCRLHGQLWSRPQLLPERLDPAMQRWWSLRARPKVLVATQTAVLEATADPAGTLVPVTPLLSVLPHDPADVWRLAVALTAPIVSRLALERHAGAGLSAGALKLSAKQLAALPLPVDQTRWDAAVQLALTLRPDQPALDQPVLAQLLLQLGLAYGQTEPDARATAAWWWARLRRSPPA